MDIDVLILRAVGNTKGGEMFDLKVEACWPDPPEKEYLEEVLLLIVKKYGAENVVVVKKIPLKVVNEAVSVDIDARSLKG